MPECKNDPTRKYKGNEPSPKGLGICAHAEKLNTKKKGKDGNIWIVTETKKGVKRWIKYILEKKDRPSPSRSATLYKEGKKEKGNDGNTYVVVLDKNDTKKWKLYKKENNKKDKKKTSIKTDKISIRKKSKKSKKSVIKSRSTKVSKNLNSFDFYDTKVIPPEDLHKYISKNEIIKKIKKKIIPELQKLNINFYLVPLPLSDSGNYYIDFINDYIEKYYNKNYYYENGIKLVIYMNIDLTINYSNSMLIQYNLDTSLQQKVFDVFSKHLPYNYEWNGDSRKTMFIHHNKQKNKIKSIKIKEISDYPQIYITGILEGKNIDLLKLGDYTKNTNEFKNFYKIEKVCKFVENEYQMKNFFLMLFGVKDIKLVKDFFKNLKKKATLTFDSNVIKIKKLTFSGYMSEDDLNNNLKFDENGSVSEGKKKKSKSINK